MSIQKTTIKEKARAAGTFVVFNINNQNRYKQETRRLGNSCFDLECHCRWTASYSLGHWPTSLDTSTLDTETSIASNMYTFRQKIICTGTENIGAVHC